MIAKHGMLAVRWNRIDQAKQHCNKKLGRSKLRWLVHLLFKKDGVAILIVKTCIFSEEIHAIILDNLWQRLIWTNLAAYFNNQGFNCTTPTMINLSGTPLVVHPLQRQKETQLFSCPNYKGVFNCTGWRSNPAISVYSCKYEVPFLVASLRIVLRTCLPMTANTC